MNVGSIPSSPPQTGILRDLEEGRAFLPMRELGRQEKLHYGQVLYLPFLSRALDKSSRHSCNGRIKSHCMNAP